MPLFDLYSPLLAGMLLGIAVSLGATVPGEEKIRHAAMYAFGAIVVAAFGGGLYFYVTTAHLEILFQFLFSFALSFVIVFLAVSVYKKSKYGGVLLDLGPGKSSPRYVINEYTVKMYGVKWRVIYGKAASWTEPYAYAKGPYCPKCDFEMEAEERGVFKRYYWKCIPCGKYYRCSEKYPSDAKEAVEKWLEAKIRKEGSKEGH